MKKTLLFMKLSFVFMFLCLFKLSASVYSQNTRLSISGKNMTVKAIFKEIEDQSEFKFLYRKDHIDDEVSLNLNEKNSTVKNILNNILLQYNNVTYTVLEDNLIVLSLKQEGYLVSGQLLDTQESKPLPGVNVYVKGSAQSGTVTDLDGKYSIMVQSKEDVIVFSYIGFLTKEIVVGNQTTINISLVEDFQELDEVLVIGYGTMKRSDITGSVSSVKEKDLNTVATTSIDNMLLGKVAGLTAMMNSAQPGGGVDVMIRGGASDENKPLYVIDGFPISNSDVEPKDGTYSKGSRSPLSSLNPNDIASVEVLKDASATAIYGARAANGVILITTKRGKAGDVSVNYNVNYSLQQPKNPYNLLSKKDFMTERNRYYRDTWNKSYNVIPFGALDPSIVSNFPYDPPFTQEEIDNADEGTDWFKEVTRTGKIQDHNITVQSGTDKTKYFASFNYFDQEGILKNIDFKRYTGRVNIDQKINNWIDLGINLSGSHITNNNSQMGGTNDKSGLLSSAYQYPATIPIKDSLGNYVINPERPVLPNPVSLLEITDISTTQRYLTRAFLKIKVLEGLYYNPSIGYDSDMGKRSRYNPKTTLAGANSGGSATISEVRRTSLIFENTLNYHKEFEDLSLDALLGMSYQDFSGEGFTASNEQFLTDVLLFNNLAMGEAERPYVASWKNPDEKLVSYFGRVHLGYKSKYLLTLTMRVDGSSTFGTEHMYGAFPSAAFAYRIIKEDFMSQQSLLSDLKIRTSYGQTGNSSIGQDALSLMSPGHNYPFNNSVNTGVYQSQLGNDNLIWETNTEFNLGLDFGLFRNRIWGNAEYFNKVITDLLDEKVLPSYYIVDKAPDNIGIRQSKGFELTLKTQNMVGDFKWSTDITLTSFKDRWKERNPDVILSIYEKEDGPLHAIYGYKTNGLTYPNNDSYIPMDSLYPHLASPLPGDLNIVDLNGMDTISNSLTGVPDGAITDADKVLLGTSVPKLSFGFNNRFEYRNFDLNIYIYGMLGLTAYNKTRAEMTKGSNLDYNTNQLDEIKNRYSPYSNPKGEIPLGINDQYGGSASDYFMEDASFVRIKSITLGYTFNQILDNKIKSLRVYIDVNNVYVFTKYTGTDPETERGSSGSMAAYPFPLTTSFGASVKF